MFNGKGKGKCLVNEQADDEASCKRSHVEGSEIESIRGHRKERLGCADCPSPIYTHHYAWRGWLFSKRSVAVGTVWYKLLIFFNFYPSHVSPLSSSSRGPGFFSSFKQPLPCELLRCGFADVLLSGTVQQESWGGTV